MVQRISLVAGGAGFIGVNLIEKLLIDENRHIVIVDNLSRGSDQFINDRFGLNNPNITFFKSDCTIRSDLFDIFSFSKNLGMFDEVWHFAANSDIPAGIEDADIDLKDTFLTTHELLNAMKVFKISNFNFASSSAVYGDLGDVLLHESIGPLMPISNYGAMKLASEALASAAAESYLNRINLFRFPNVVGIPATHGVIFDFIQRLLTNPCELMVLGDGTQQKSYLHVSDLVRAMLIVRNATDKNRREFVNIGPVDNGVTVRWIAESVVSRISPDARIIFGSGNKGWVGDVPKFFYSTEKLKSFGWAPELDSAQAIARAIDEIAAQLGGNI